MIQPIFADITTLHMFGRMFPDGTGVSSWATCEMRCLPSNKVMRKETDNEEFKQKGWSVWRLSKSETKGENLSKFLYTCLVKLGENSEGVSSQGPKKGVCMCYFGISQSRLMGSIVALRKCPSRYINAYMWNLKQWHRWSYLQTEIETQTQTYGHQWGEEGGGIH